MFARAKPAKAAQVVAQQIKDAVLSGKLSFGDKLPAERNLIEQFGYSRSVVREALRLLEDDGLIELQAGRNGGAVVLTRTRARSYRSSTCCCGCKARGCRKLQKHNA